jgi:micrococcal nuclease
MKSKSPVLLAIGAVLGFSAGCAATGIRETACPLNHGAGQGIEESVEKSYRVARVVDGDTVVLEDGVYVELKRIRFLGIDTPDEKDPLYEESKQKMRELTAGRVVLLERDRKNTDGLERLLRYVFVDGRNINVEMVRLGYARAYMHKGLRYEAEILAAEREAREQKRGIWARR